MHFNLFAVSVHLSCWLQTRVKYVASAWTIQLLINAVAATPCFCPALSRGSARSSACNLLMNVERLRCRPFRSQILIENCTRECTKRDDDPVVQIDIFQLRVIFLNEGKIWGIGTKSERKWFDIENCKLCYFLGREKRDYGKVKCDDNYFYWGNFIIRIHFCFEDVKWISSNYYWMYTSFW